MPDSELDLYQQLEELRYEAEQRGAPFDWNVEKQQLLASRQAE
jgi:hypothetical protein